MVLVYEDECITRYDTAHGFANRDVLGRKSGLIEKRSCESSSKELAESRKFFPCADRSDGSQTKRP